MNTAKQIIGRLVITTLVALSLTSNLYAQPVLPPGGTNAPPTPEELEAARQAWLVKLNAEYTNNFAPWIHPTQMSEFGLPISTSFSSWQSEGVTGLLSLGTALGNWQANQAAAATNLAQTSDWPLTVTNDNAIAVMIGAEGGAPVYISTFNLNAADTVGADELWTNGSSGLNLNGEGTQIGVWDIGDARLTHREFTTNSTRILDMDGVSPDGVQDHVTHVSGTLGSYGVTGAAKGMSSRAVILANDVQLHFSEMPNQAATNFFRLSNHSYGIASMGWFGTFTFQGTNYPVWYGDAAYSQTEDFKFGRYETNSQSIDRIIYSSRYYLPVWAAANERGPSGKPAISQANGHIGFSNSAAYLFKGITRPDDGGTTGYDTLPPHGLAKNCLAVGAVSNIVNGYSGSNSVGMSTFSSFGPTDDGRIKPDVVGDGVNLYSSGSFFDDDYYTSSGTSMASPNVCGSLNLLVQLHNRDRGTNQPMLSSTLRGLAIHTADESGTTLGPDYKFGWGLLNVLKAARLMTNNFVSNSVPVVKEVKLLNGDFIQFPIVAKGGEPLKVTLCWTDPAGNPQPVALNPTNRVLVNDVDLRLTTATTTNLPWVLNPASPANTAVQADNDRDNVEQVFISNPTSNGVYTVRVAHKGTLKNDTGATSDQWVSILLSGNVAQTEPPFVIEKISQISTNTVGVRWPSTVGRIYQFEFRDDVASGTWSPATGEISATKTNIAVELPMNSATRFYRLARVR